ncbi:MAG: aldo/keto reductase [Planctomycetota bacterium]|nr:aldo/keto reductase [Planctomycetota bacterium]MDA1142146.1 aldo/keto reductase [Planctomycetota bacterium]
MNKQSQLGKGLPPVCRLGLATRGNTSLDAEDVHMAFERGINYWNWCGKPDGLSNAVGELGAQRDEVVLALQLDTLDSSRDGILRALDSYLKELDTDRIDVATLYYVESEDEWRAMIAAGGAMEGLQQAREQGLIRMIGLTSHQRRLAAGWTASGLIDLLMIRYNAAHRGAEEDVFPVTNSLGIPVVAFTCLRWGGLLKSTAGDPEGFVVPRAADWYRFVISNPSVSVALMAPNGKQELEVNLSILERWQSLSQEELTAMKQHGDRVHASAGTFP